MDSGEITADLRSAPTNTQHHFINLENRWTMTGHKLQHCKEHSKHQASFPTVSIYCVYVPYP